ncbi:MAG: L-histidine N(alpha)-methyltransferase [Methanomicrobiaceae archaeon]|nr:L-histidine N(alpha)-methyltransferase [Methanomicrobiaceae archaeon]
MLRQSQSHPQVELHNHLTVTFNESLAHDVREGLTADRKRLPSKYFYDSRGSRLFDRICSLPEYYLTRTEMKILGDHAHSIMQPFARGDLVEMGSGSHHKISRLLHAVNGTAGAQLRYIPFDVSRNALLEASRELMRRFPQLCIMGYVADFTAHLHLLPHGSKRLFLLFGSTIGNFPGPEAVGLLRNVRAIMAPDDRFLLGLDMVKPPHNLNAAYNDSRGVTSSFNKNILTVINRHLHADFNPAQFDHLAFYNEEKEQVEMHLQAREAATVNIADIDLSVDFKKGETIHTEISRKFTPESARILCAHAGLEISRWFSDAQGWFSLVELVPRRG